MKIFNILIISLFLVTSAYAESKPIGKVVQADGTVTILRNAEGITVPARPSEPVYENDEITTGNNSSASLMFVDKSFVNMTANAHIVLNSLIYDPESKNNSMLTTITKGTFTFISGAVAKTGNMKIETPVATAGIRGTVPRIEIRDDGSVIFGTILEDGLKKNNPK